MSADKTTLVAIPCLYHASICRMAIAGVIADADVLVIDNGAPDDVKEVIASFNLTVISNEVNMYVNYAWNQALAYFLNSRYEQLIIMNSDLVMKPGWFEKLRRGVSCIPTDSSHLADTVVTEGVPGVFIHLNKETAMRAYPIPDAIKIWYGDNWIYTRVRQAGYQTIIIAGMLCEHFGNGSRTVNIVPNKTEIIAQDQLAWIEVQKYL